VDAQSRTILRPSPLGLARLFAFYLVVFLVVGAIPIALLMAPAFLDVMRFQAISTGVVAGLLTLAVGARYRVILDVAGIDARSLFGHRRTPWSDIEKAGREGGWALPRVKLTGHDGTNRGYLYEWMIGAPAAQVAELVERHLAESRADQAAFGAS